jgi:hypothetical protein
MRRRSWMRGELSLGLVCGCGGVCWTACQIEYVSTFSGCNSGLFSTFPGQYGILGSDFVGRRYDGLDVVELRIRCSLFGRHFGDTCVVIRATWATEVLYCTSSALGHYQRRES